LLGSATSAGKDRIHAKGIPAERILVVPPWSHDDRVRFDPGAREWFRAIHKLSHKFVVMYSGNHSPCHPLETFLHPAERLAENEDVAFCFVGGGSEFVEKILGPLSAADLHVVVMGSCM
jgi:colanic acid biosynthesis glycosyl transferase WcaI